MRTDLFGACFDNNHASEELSASSPLAEVLWNFSRYKDSARITLEQNPHFYLWFPADESAYTPTFQHYPLQDTIGALKHNDTIYVLIDNPGRVFLHTEHKSRIFGNIWSLNSSLIFRGLCHVSLSHRFPCDIFPDNCGVLSGERLVRGSSTRFHVRHFEQSVAFHGSVSRSRWDRRCLRSIITKPLANPSSYGEFEDWTILSRRPSHSFDIHIYVLRGSPASTRSLVCFHASGFTETVRKLLHRTYLHRLQRPRDLTLGCYTRLSIRSKMIYSWAYSTSIDWLVRMFGMGELGGANPLMFVGDGVTSYTSRHSTWVCIFYAPKVPL